LGVVTVLIMLTHYQAIVPVAGLACFAAWFWWRKDRHRAIHIMGALIAAAIVVLAAHPQFFRSFGRYGAQFRGGPSWSERLQIVTPAPSFFFARRPDGRIAATAAAGSLVVVAAAFRRFRGRNPAELSWGDPALRATCLVMIWTSAGLVGLYLFRFSPGHAFAPQYLSMIYPLMAVIVVAALNRMPWALAGLVGLMIWDVAAVARWEAPSIGAHRRIDMADRLVIDKPARGVALPIVARLPADKMVFVAHSQDLIAAPAPWLDPLTTRSAWVSDSRYSRSADERTRIRRLLKRKFDIVEAHTVGERTVFELKEPAVAPADVRP
jgi:hypothetical protein